jgi:acyl-CoA synthetase (AMP-forming)/AMP-acid ligase II
MSVEMTGLADIVRQHAAKRPDTAALVHAGRTTGIETLPRNPTGKILKRELRRSYWGDKQRQVN